MKYEITKEQIESLRCVMNISSCENGISFLKEWFPEAFKTVLEVGKWYKDLRSSFLYHPVDIKNSNAIKAYGFDAYGKYNELGGFVWGIPNEFKEATKEEVLEALKNEAVKRYKDGCFVHSFMHNKPLKINDSGIQCEFIYEYNKLHFGSHGNKCVVVFENGKWAEITPTITKQEAEKQLGKKIID